MNSKVGRLGKLVASQINQVQWATMALLVAGQLLLFILVGEVFAKTVVHRPFEMLLVYGLCALLLSLVALILSGTLLQRRLRFWTNSTVALARTVEKLIHGELHKPISPPKQSETELDQLYADMEILRMILQKQFRNAQGPPRLDELTNLWNRTYFNEKLALEIRDCAVNDQHCFCVLLCDIDYLKAVNDAFGYGEGDRVLKEVAMKIQHNIRKGDVLARYGGEEFALIAYMDVRSAFDYAERMRRSARFVTVQGQRISISIGISEYREGDSPDLILHRAEEALYQSKQNGRNCVNFIA